MERVLSKKIIFWFLGLSASCKSEGFLVNAHEKSLLFKNSTTKCENLKPEKLEIMSGF